MFKNYLKIALRNIIKHKGYSAINILGLAAGIACCILILLYVQFELGYDKFHRNGNRIYRIAREKISGEKIDKFARTPAPMAPALISDFPEIEKAVRMDKPHFKIFIKSRNTWIHEGNFLCADPSIFKVFSFPFSKGDPESALTGPYSIVITERMATKYFPGESPLGKSITFKRSYDWLMSWQRLEDKPFIYKVTGVLKNIPQNSHIKFDFIIPFNTFNRSYLNQWGAWNFITYILLRENCLPEELEKKFPGFLEKYRKRKANILKLYLQPLPDIHLYSKLRGEMEAGGHVGYLFLFSTIAVIILLTACINFMTLSTALSFSRYREAGLRKVLGAGRKELIGQFLGESIVHSFLALPIAALLARLILPAFNTIVGREISINYSEQLSLLPVLVLMTFVVGIVSGSYPAYFASGFQPSRVLKGNLQTGQTKKLSRSVPVTIQFTISVFFIVCSIVGYQQLNFVKTTDMGFTKEGMIRIPVHSKKILNSIEAIKNELLKNKNIMGVTATNISFSDITDHSHVEWEGLPQNSDESMNGIAIDSGFIDTLGIKLKAGKNLVPSRGVGFLLNQSAVEKIGWESPAEAIGKQFSYAGYLKGRIVGVINDFNFKSLHQNIQPLVLFYEKNIIDSILVKINMANIEGTLKYIEKTWNTFDPFQLFEFFFFENIFHKLYSEDRRMQRIFQYAAVMSIFIACLGLFGLVSLSGEQRTKEIGIRKTFGASVSNIIVLLLKELVVWIVLSNVIAWPIAYFVMEKWLQEFSYRTDIGLWIFFLAAAVSIVIALLTTGYRAVKAALVNPVEWLRHE